MIWRLLLRAVAIITLFWLFALVGLAHWLVLRVTGSPPERRAALVGTYLAGYCRMMGATFVKAGQILSTRPDLASLELRRPLQALHDRVGPFRFAQVRELMAVELGAPVEEVFAELDPYPVASGSVAQVHRGRLHDGRTVAVKVLRPGIETVVALDLRLMRILARAVGWVPAVRSLGPAQVVETFADAIGKQLDLRLEADNTRRFARNFEGVEDVSFPLLVDELCRQRTLCMSFIDGEKVLARTWDRAEDIVRTGFRMVLKMVFIDGFVHADLHPGNIFVVDGHRLALVDLGLVASVSARHRLGLTRLLLAWASADVERICEAVSQVGFYGQPPADAQRLRADVSALLERYRHRSMAEIEVGRLLQDLIRMMRKQWAQLDSSTTMIALAVGVVEGLGKELAPQLKLVDEALPFVQRAAAAAAEAEAAAP